MTATATPTRVGTTLVFQPTPGTSLPDDAWVLHRSVMAMFPQAAAPARATMAVLFRRVAARTGEALLVRSAVPPVAPMVGCTLAGAFPDPELSAGQEYRFEVVAAPTMRKATTRQVVPLPPEVWQHWLARHLEPCEIVEGEATPEEPVRGYDRNRHAAIFHPAARFSGRLQVTDASAFARLLRDGVGRGRAYGLGMLVVSL
ncbi:MAG: type I-E CRISPR-associated protein Cas6/Cse3/CasE [Actinobacteria bacterium]|nr:type I-E CRISPR-associated protein Cas6/Cse3/CasE [Actinomycetota bacterium]